MKKHAVFVILALSLLFGCVSQDPAVKVIVQEVKVPVREVCIQQSSIPVRAEYVTVTIKQNDSRITKTKKLIVHYSQSEAYIKTLETILQGCSE